ncbi:MAG: hypothetical protein ACE3L7_00105 [Candidatus Pristimantibacillus sp.]
MYLPLDPLAGGGGLKLDELSIHRWIQERKPVDLRLSSSSEIRIPMESAVRLLVTEMRQEVARLRKEHDSLKRQLNEEAQAEEPPF